MSIEDDVLARRGAVFSERVGDSVLGHGRVEAGHFGAAFVTHGQAVLVAVGGRGAERDGPEHLKPERVHVVGGHQKRAGTGRRAPIERRGEGDPDAGERRRRRVDRRERAHVTIVVAADGDARFLNGGEGEDGQVDLDRGRRRADRKVVARLAGLVVGGARRPSGRGDEDD